MRLDFTSLFRPNPKGYIPPNCRLFHFSNTHKYNFCEHVLTLNVIKRFYPGIYTNESQSDNMAMPLFRELLKFNDVILVDGSCKSTERYLL